MRQRLSGRPRWQIVTVGMAGSILVLCSLCLCLSIVGALLPTREDVTASRTASTEAVRAVALTTEPAAPTDTSTPIPTALPTDTLAPTRTPSDTPIPTAALTSTQVPTPVTVEAPAPAAGSNATPRSTNTPTPTVPAGTAPAQTASNMPVGAVAARLSKVVDGDTIDVIIDGRAETVRYIGIDTPERGQPGYRAATDANAALLGTGDLYLVADTSERDQYRRLLRYVYTPDGAMINQALVAQGLAQPVEYPPDTRFATELRSAASAAAAAKLGFWGGTASDGAMPYALVTGSANIRKGPGTSFPINTTVPANTPLTVFGRTPDGQWLQVRTPDRSGGWISASLIALAVAASQVQVAQDIPAPPVAVQPTTPSAGSLVAPIILPTAEPQTAPQSTLQGIVLFIVENHNSFEILQIDNRGQQAADISDWALYGSKGDERCVIPGGTVLQPGEGFQVATGDSQPQTRGMKCGDKPIWNNDGETIYLEAPGGGRIEIQSRRV